MENRNRNSHSQYVTTLIGTIQLILKFILCVGLGMRLLSLRCPYKRKKGRGEGRTFCCKELGNGAARVKKEKFQRKAYPW